MSTHSDGLTWAIAQAKSTAEESAVYWRGGDSVDLTVILGNSSDESIMDDVTLRNQRRRILIEASTLILSGVVVVPLKGDLIKVTIGADVRVYEVMPYGLDKPWSYSAGAEHLLLVQTNYLTTE
jgi:hypothetical protein